MSRGDDELTHMLREAQRPVAVEGLFESLERRTARVVAKRHLKGRSRGGPGSSQRWWEPFLAILRSVKR